MGLSDETYYGSFDRFDRSEIDRLARRYGLNPQEFRSQDEFYHAIEQIHKATKQKQLNSLDFPSDLHKFLLNSPVTKPTKPKPNKLLLLCN